MNSTSKPRASSWPLFVVVGVVVVVFLASRWEGGCTLPDIPLPEPNGPDGPPMPAGMDQHVVALKGFISDKQDAAIAAGFYRELADMIERDREVIRTSSQLMKAWRAAEKVLYQRTDMVGKYPGWGDAVADAQESAGLMDDANLSDELRGKWVSFFRAVAAAVLMPKREA